MTSIVVLLYFKQENCEILISLYNWGWMKHCQSQLVSYKVEWFCSLAGFSWWSGLFLFFSFSLSLSLQMLFPAGLFFFFFFAHPFSEEQRKSSGRDGPEVRVALLQPIRVVCVHTRCCSSSRKPADLTTSTLFDCRTIRYLHLLVLCDYIYSFSYLHSAKRKKKETSVLSVLSSRAQTGTLACW